MKNKDAKKFNTYDLRMRKVRELSAKSCNEVYVKVCDCQNLLYSRKVLCDPEVKKLVKTLKLDIQEYIDHLENDKTIDVQSVNIVNRALDKRVAEVKGLIEDYDSTLANELDKDVRYKIRKSGYSYLFDEEKMNQLLEEKVELRKYALSEKQINQGKAIAAMFSNLYSPEATAEMIESLKLVEQEA